jgi:hypothetical protein
VGAEKAEVGGGEGGEGGHVAGAKGGVGGVDIFGGQLGLAAAKASLKIVRIGPALLQKRTIRDVRVMSEAQRRITWLLNSR